MSNTTAISVSNLAKSYLVGHQSASSEGYTSLRDVMAKNTKNLFRKTYDMLQGRPIVDGDEVEEFWALKNIDFEIKQGDRVGIIGRNGAGKSTLLKILSRITEPTKGRISINGRVASLLEVGTGFHPELTGRENIFLNGAILGMSQREIRRKFDEIVDFAEVEKFLDTPVKRYSSGMYVRLAFAVAAHLEPEILIVDEVLAVGDARFQKKCMGRMEEVGKEGRTVLFVSHNMGAISELCNRAILLGDGKVLLDGNINEAVTRYSEVEGAAGTITLSKKNKYPVYVTHMRLLDSLSKAVTKLSLGEDAILEFGFNIDHPATGVSIAILLSRAGTPLIYSHDNDIHSELLDAYRESGSYVAQIKLPLRKFKEGNYTLEVQMGVGATNMTDKDAVISFLIENHEINTQNKGYRIDRPGQLYWPLDWDIKSS